MKKPYFKPTYNPCKIGCLLKNRGQCLKSVRSLLLKSLRRGMKPTITHEFKGWFASTTIGTGKGNNQPGKERGQIDCKARPNDSA
eukprot:12891445-Prorocentrum_lima.AAC.1